MRKHTYLTGLLVLGLAVIVSLSACGRGPVRLAKKDSGRTINLRVGKKLEVVLEANPTTGYLWSVASIDSAVLKQAGTREYKRVGKAIGAGGKSTFRFDAVGKGKMKLELIYRRLWEHDVPPLETFEVTVNVK